jgi:hypothetical protein
VVEFYVTQCGGPNTHARVGFDGQAIARGFDDEQCGLAVELGCDHEQFGVGGRWDQ